jgi:hypothetical protein
MSAIWECTASNPWDGKKGPRVRHHGAEEVGDQRDGYPGGDIVTKRCRFCQHEWTEELPQ